MYRGICSALSVLALLMIHPSASLAQSFGDVQKFAVGQAPSRIVTADFNNDGIPDLVTLENSGNSITSLTSKGDGTFQTPWHYDLFVAGNEIVPADATGNNDMDLIIYHSAYETHDTTMPTDSIYWYEGLGNGTFKGPQFCSGCGGYEGTVGPMAVGDIRSDGRPAIAYAVHTADSTGQIANKIRIMYHDNSGGPVWQSTSYPDGTGKTVTDPVVGNFNDDRHLDIAFAEVGVEANPDARLIVLSNQADMLCCPTFTPVTIDTVHLPVIRVNHADLNNDGKDDFVLTYRASNGRTGFISYINRALGEFDRGSSGSVDASLYADPTATAVADFTGDKLADVALLTRKNPSDALHATDVVLIFPQNTDGTFGTPKEFLLGKPGESVTPTNLVTGDWNYDGWQDLATASTIGNTVLVLLNTTGQNVPPPPPPPAPAPDFGVSLSASSLTVKSGASATINVSVSALNGFNGAVALACSGLPAHAACSFSPAQVTPGSTAVSSTLTISTNSTTASLRHSQGLVFAMSFAAVGFVFAGSLGNRRRRVALVTGMLTVLALAVMLAACGGGGGASPAPSPAAPAVNTPITTASGSYTITVIATSGSITHSSTVTLNVQ